MAAVQTPIVGGMFYTMLGDAIFTHLRLQGTERTTSAGSSAYSMLRETQRTPAAQEFQQSPAPPAACRIGPAHPATYARALRPPDRLCTGTVIDFGLMRPISTNRSFHAKPTLVDPGTG